jgi:hypothetical protein
MIELECKLNELENMLREDGYNASNIVIQTLNEAREQVKLFAIPVVSQQRELLKFFSAQLSENLDIDVGMNYITEEDIEECIKNFNCP